MDPYKGILLLEYELVSQFGEQRPPLSNNFALGTTLVPSVLFTLGQSVPSIKNSVLLMGLGYAHNFVAGQPKRVFGFLQKCGAATILFHLFNKHNSIPFISFAAFTVLSHFSENPEKPFASASKSGQTQLDRKLVGESRMLNKDYDPDSFLPTLMATSSIWFGYFIKSQHFSANERLITGWSLLSLGYMLWYAYPNQFPFSQTFWTPSFALTTAGISLLNYTTAQFVLNLLEKNGFGSLVNALGVLGKAGLPLYFVSAFMDRLKVNKWIRWGAMASVAVLSSRYL